MTTRPLALILALACSICHDLEICHAPDDDDYDKRR